MDAPSDTDTGDTVANNLPTPPRISLVSFMAGGVHFPADETHFSMQANWFLYLNGFLMDR